jgi:hypothetical protein
MLVAPTLMKFSAVTGAGPTLLPDLRHRKGTVALAVSCVRHAQVTGLLNDMRAACEKETAAPFKMLMQMDKAITQLAYQPAEPKTRLERLARFMESGRNLDELADDDLKHTAEFGLAVDLGDWAQAESVVRSMLDDPSRMSKLFVPLQSDFGIY